MLFFHRRGRRTDRSCGSPQQNPDKALLAHLQVSGAKKRDEPARFCFRGEP